MKPELEKLPAYIARNLGRSVRLIVASLCIGSSLYISPSPAYAIYCSNCSTFYQQMFEYAEQVNTALNTAEQLQIQIQQYQNMLTQGSSLPNSMFDSIAADLKSVVNIYQRSQALGRQIQNMDAQFNTAYPGFEDYLAQEATSGEVQTRDRYERWSEQGRDNVRSALGAVNINTSTFESEGAQLERMMARSQNAAGRMQAIQAGNEIASQNVQQLQKLRDLVATQINMQGNYMAQEGDRKVASEAAEQQFEARQSTRGGVKEY